MDRESPTQAELIQSAFLDYEKNVRIQNYRLACILAAIFMPAGLPMDYLVYPQHTGFFFQLRLLCAACCLFIWWLVQTRIGLRCYKALGLVVAALPSFFISWMIFATEGPRSPYYAGLNLVLVGAALVLRWTLRDSAAVFLTALAMYLGACLLHGPITDFSGFFSNLWFMSVTGIFVIISSLVYNRLRFREFALRFELDENRQQLEASNEKLRQLDEAKSRFFANISHELRTPLTLLIAPLETMLHRFRHKLDEETLGLVQTMHSNGMRLLKLINDLLDIVRLESGRLQIKREPVEIREFVHGLTSATRQVADDKRIRLATTVAPEVGPVLADRDKLEKTLLNLLFNSLKFTPAGGRVELRVGREADQLVLRVEDTGMGIAANQLPHVFDRFWQADDSARRKYQGVGIGLSLVKEFTELQGGSVSVESEVGQGSTFTVRLPYLEVDAAPAAAQAGADVTAPDTTAAAPPETPATATSQEWLANLYRRAELFPAMTSVREAVRPVETARNGDHPKLLIADDEPDMLRFLKSQLAPHYQVIEAVDGQQAVDKAGQFLPDLILLDMMMPEKDGMQACREIREKTATRSIPVILITARADEETKLAALAAGANDFLPKPFSTTELHVRVNNLVQSFQYQRQLTRQNQSLEQTIDQLKETETQLVQTEKLASLGRLSAGLIHEINNPLNFATTGLFTLRGKSRLLAGADRSEYDEILRDVEDGIKRVKTIVSDLRGFSHPDDDPFDEVPVAHVIESALRFLSHEWRDKVRVERVIPEGQIIRGNQNRLIQVVLNLLQNSLDALKTKVFTDEAPEIRIEGRVEEGASCLVVRDNGPGIEAEHLDKIFDPFFTTRDVGQGMGLGLSICYRIVQECDGQITVRSEPGKFCEFTLRFPLTDHARAAAARAN